MILEKKNQTAIHNVLIKDLQHRLFKQHELNVLQNATPDELGDYDNDFDNNLSMLVSLILKCETLNDVNELLCNYEDLFVMTNSELPYVDKYSVCSLDGTMNYLFVLLANSDKCSCEPNHEYYK
jgi:hypothetical protein